MGRLVTNFYDYQDWVPGATAWFAIDPNMTFEQKCNYNTFIRNLQVDGLWDNLYGIYPFHGTGASTAAKNMKNPGSTATDVSFVGSPTFSQANGVTLNGTTQYVTTNFTLGSTGVSGFGMSLQNISHGIYHKGFTSTATHNLSGNNTSTGTPGGGRLSISRLNTGASFADCSYIDAEGRWYDGTTTFRNTFFIAQSRFGNAGTLSEGVYQRGASAFQAQLTANAMGSTAMFLMGSLHFGAINSGGTAGGFCPFSLTFAFIGRGLTVQGMLNMYQRVSELVRALGRTTQLPGIDN